jgi:ankyrin repeat protein
MQHLSADDPVAVAAVQAIQTGDLATLKKLLKEHSDLASARLGAEGRSLLHVVTDWPGHFPNGGTTVALLVEAGADVNVRFEGFHNETPLHWSASCDDVEVLDALLDAGADIEATGAVIGGGTPLADATGFGQWNAAYRLIERGAKTTLAQAATLGLMERVESYFSAQVPPRQEEVDVAFWGACHGGQRRTAQYLLERGALLNWIPPWEKLTPLDAARRRGAQDLIDWLIGLGASSASEITRRDG